MLHPLEGGKGWKSDNTILTHRWPRCNTLNTSKQPALGACVSFSGASSINSNFHTSSEWTMESSFQDHMSLLRKRLNPNFTLRY